MAISVPAVDADLDYLVSDERVHRAVYTDPAIFDLEMARIFGSTWVFIGHESEVPARGSFKTTYIGHNPVLMVRHTDDTVRVLLNRCMHRGALVCREPRGNAPSFACLYHGWTYGTDGRLIAVGMPDGYSERPDPYAFGLRPVARVESYRGFVFGCLNPDVAPLETHLGRAKVYIDMLVDRAPDGEVAVSSRISKYAYRGNWKLLLENWTDSYHPSFAHEAFFGIQSGIRAAPSSMGDNGSENVALGNGHTMLDYSAAKDGPKIVGGRVDPEQLELLAKRLGGEEAERVLTDSNMNLNLYPNLLFRTDTQGFQVIRPVRVDYTESWYHSYNLVGAPERLNDQIVQRGGARALDPIQTDDMEAYERIQEGLGIESIEWLYFHRGIHRERHLPNGEIRGMGADEVGHREQHRQWKRLMGGSE